MDRYSWLPDYQQHVVYSLAYADDLIARTGRVLNEYTKQGTLRLKDVVADNTVHLTVTGVVPLPQAVPRLASDALNQLRSTLEHVVYAEIVHKVERPLTSKEARSIEMPAKSTPDEFDQWLKQGHRRNLAPLQPGEPLCERLRNLQPFQHQEAEAHPLRILVEHTNWSKHRTPPVAATQIGAVTADVPTEDLWTPTGQDRPIEIGDVLARVPVGRKVPLSIWPKISIKRPHTESWHILLYELRDLEQWVREVALPLLIAGTTDIPPLPPHLDTTVGYADFRAALAAASPTPAANRTMKDLLVGDVREGLTEVLVQHPEGRMHVNAINRWVASLSAEEVLQKTASLQLSGLQQRNSIVKTMIADALSTTGTQ